MKGGVPVIVQRPLSYCDPDSAGVGSPYETLRSYSVSHLQGHPGERSVRRRWAGDAACFDRLYYFFDAELSRLRQYGSEIWYGAVYDDLGICHGAHSCYDSPGDWNFSGSDDGPGRRVAGRNHDQVGFACPLRKAPLAVEMMAICVLGCLCAKSFVLLEISRFDRAQDLVVYSFHGSLACFLSPWFEIETDVDFWFL